ncbi:MAG TPA: NAD(P)-dependent oxidoreductase [Planctomycetota bacterium]|jgi:NADH dehydrogenase|nr:NAD(P)-dependent oxidoreductase [Planctomycetota bacterium]
MKIALTGGTGFIGGYLGRGLAGAGHDLRLLVRAGRENAVAASGLRNPEIHVGDLTKTDSLSGFLDGVDLLVHVASAHDHFTEAEMRAVNIGGTEALLAEGKARANPGFQIWVISSAVIGAPVYSYYRDSKRVQEKLIRGSGIPWASFRPTLVYGVGDHRHTARWLRRCGAKGGTLWVPHDGLSKINPVHVDDVVDAVLRFFAFERGVDCCYELAGPNGIPYNEFVDLTIAAAGGGIRRRNIPKKWADRFIFLKGLFVDNTEDRRASAYFNLHHEHDISNATFELGWKPRPYAEGIRAVAAGGWWREERSAAPVASASGRA